MDDQRLALLERIARGAVAMTTRALATAAPGEDVTFPQWRVILILGEEPSGVRLGEIARRVGVTLPATSRLLDRMARRDLVAFQADTLDRRATRAVLTEHGAAVRGAILEHRQDALLAVAAAVRQAERRHGALDDGCSVDAILEVVAAGFDRFT